MAEGTTSGFGSNDDQKVGRQESDDEQDIRKFGCHRIEAQSPEQQEILVEPLVQIRDGLRWSADVV